MTSSLGSLRTQGVIALSLLLFGFGLVTQLRSYNQLSERLEAQSESDLVEIIDSLDGEIRSMRSELTDQQIKLVSFRDSEAGNDGIIDKTKDEIADLKVLLGKEAAEGPGITIDIKDPQRQLIGFDLRQIIEEMRASGAWAVAVNGRRIHGRTSLWRRSGYIYVDGRKLAPNFKLEAVGDSDVLYQAITLPGGIRDTLASTYRGVTVKVGKAEALKLKPTTFNSSGRR